MQSKRDASAYAGNQTRSTLDAYPEERDGSDLEPHTRRDEPESRQTLPDGPAPSHESVERVTISTLPRSAEETTRRRPRHAMAELPGRWTERLLHVWSELPVTKGDHAVTRTVVDAVASILEDCSVGACLVPADGGAQEVIKASEHTEQRAQGADPTRLFPGCTYERVVALETGGSTLHVAGEDPGIEDHGSSVGTFIGHAAVVATRGLELARMQARAVTAVSDLRAINAHMVQQEKLASLGQIAAGVVHELNNPLTSIVAYTDYLIRRANARGGHETIDDVDRLNRIAESAGRMLRFTRDLVSYARPSSETPVKVAPYHVIEQAIAFCEHVLADANVSVVRQLAPDLPPVQGKPEQLAQIFVNLVTNACHAMAPAGGGTLTLSTREEDGFVRIQLSDTGHGILPEHLGQIFAPFFTTKVSGAGTGLGLAIVKGIVDSHGGTIRATSVYGKGATFTVMLPKSRL
jgi:signal transduction histidine kinase